MNYLVLATDHIDQMISNTLKVELKRFDVRAKFFSSTNMRWEESPKMDAILRVGTSAVPNHRQLRSVPTFEITLESKKCKFLKRTKALQKSTIYSDFQLPRHEATDYFGSPLLDQFKRLDFNSTSENGKKIPIIHGFGSRSGTGRINRIQAKLKKKMPDAYFPVVNLDFPEIESAFSQISNANAAIVTSWLAELATLHFNIPYLFVDTSPFFDRKIFSMQNEHSNTAVIKEFSNRDGNGMASELEKILNDYQYSAGMLYAFQETKISIGSKPSIRTIAQDIILKLED